jgi:hypothetical protein
MKSVFPLSGEIQPLDFPSVLFGMHKQSISGTLELHHSSRISTVFVENKKVIFVSSGSEAHTLRQYLIEEKIIDNSTAKRAVERMKKKKIRFGRALLELGLLDNDGLWKAVQDHLKFLVFSFFHFDDTEYRINTEKPEIDERIILNEDIVSLIIHGMRNFGDKSILYKKLERIDRVFHYKPETAGTMNLKPYELHILQLVENESSVKKILKMSELLKFDTLRILYMLMVLDVISNEKIELPLKRSFDPSGRKTTFSEEDGVVRNSTFISFDEALEYFNMKYEMIYKILSKEIGPIALSILSKSIEDISEKLPFFLKKVTLKTDGSVQKTPILKSVWYYDFEQYIGQFVKGLEEILYAEIYAVKKHLGIEYEQQILKWIH